MTEIVRLVSPDGASEVVIDLSTGAPSILHWGSPLGVSADLAELRRAVDRPLVHGALDVVAPLSIVPEHASGFPGRPGLIGRRGGGRDWAPRCVPLDHRIESADVGPRLIVRFGDPSAGLELEATIALGEVLVVSVSVTNTAARRWSLDQLTVTVPLPDHLDEVLRFEGRWSREFHEVRTPWQGGAMLVENRRGRTSHESPPLTVVGRHGFGEWEGEVVAAHLAWSGNHQLLLDRLADGRRYLQAGELLLPGEVVLEPGESYRTPDLVLSRSDRGLTPTAWGFHRYVRSFDTHPTTPRPVLINTWEAVYFDHDLGRLRELADVAASIGVERFVLDDGWFGSRRDDTSGLGDWVVSDEAHPDGLEPIIEHVTGLGMQFGIWVEPEMVSPDSDLFREHPDWVLTDDPEPVLGRQQLVLDLARPEAFEYVRSQLDRLLGSHDISFVKWDMNRDHVAASGASGAAGAHEQTLAVYRLLDTLRTAHPDVEFESCASGGGRIDLEILRRAERVWTSDCNDALERQRIQRGASRLIPPEVMGAHIGPPRAHTTGRRQSLTFRAVTAIFGHLGLEWDVTQASAVDRDRLRQVIELHREHRALLHAGDVVRFDTESDVIAHGVYAADRSEALLAFVRLETGPSLTSPPLRLPDLTPDAVYRVEQVPLDDTVRGPARSAPAWIDGGIELTGAQLAAHGIRPPSLHPESAVLLRLRRLSMA